MFGAVADRIRRSDINYRLLIPLMLSAAVVQAVVAIVRVTTSYRVVELDLPVVWLGIISADYALLPAFLALWLGRFIDRGHDALAAWIGAVLMVVANAVLMVSGASKVLLLVATAVLGIANLFTIVSQQMLCVRCSRRASRESVFGNYMVAVALGQGVGPMIVGWAGGSATVPPTEFLFVVGFAGAVLALACTAPIRPSPKSSADQAGKPVMSVFELLRLPGLWAVMLASVITVTAGDLIVVYLPLLGAERTIDASDIGGLLTARAIASMAARLLYARMIAIFGRVPLMVASLAGGSIAIGCIAAPMPPLLLYAAMVATGFTVGIANTITITTVVAMTSTGVRATANSLRVTGNRIAQVALPFGASLVAAAAGAASIFIIIAASLVASGLAVYWSQPGSQRPDGRRETIDERTNAG
jgi:predicted MFS family arabinose efflux permease